MNQCELKSNKALNSFFEQEILKMDVQLLSLKLPKPALRALIRLNIYTMFDLGEISLEKLQNAHGLGITSIEILKPYINHAILM